MVVFFLCVIIAILALTPRLTHRLDERERKMREEADRIQHEGQRARDALRLAEFKMAVDRNILNGSIDPFSFSAVLRVCEPPEFAYLLSRMLEVWGSNDMACRSIRYEISDNLEKSEAFQNRAEEGLDCLYRFDRTRCIQVVQQLWPTL